MVGAGMVELVHRLQHPFVSRAGFNPVDIAGPAIRAGSATPF